MKCIFHFSDDDRRESIVCTLNIRDLRKQICELEVQVRTIATVVCVFPLVEDPGVRTCILSDSVCEHIQGNK